MGGIINYYHGESGLILSRQQLITREQGVHVLQLQGDPHRKFAYDYGADVGVDPLLKTGDTAFFVRIDAYSGIWVREVDQLYPELQEPIARVTEERRRGMKPDRVTVPLPGCQAEQSIAEVTQGETGPPFSDEPATDVSFFLSFSSANVLIARQLYEDLKYDAKVEVWFDIAQAGEAPEHSARIEAWLREAVYNCRGFILLWTRAAKESAWVRKEMTWASENAARDPDFHFVVLQLDEERIPTDLLGRGIAIDCYDLWPVNGVTEELYAAVTRRPGRTAWVNEHHRRGIEIKKDDGCVGYEPFRSDSGIAISLRQWKEDNEFCWELEYEKDRSLHRTSGCGRDKAVDLGIRSGDYVAFFVCHRAPLVRFRPGTPVWMRSRDLQIRPEDVVVAYKRAAGEEEAANNGTT